MTDIVTDTKLSTLRSVVASETCQSGTFLDARSEQDLLCGIQREMKAGTLPKSVARLMEELYLNYRNAVFQSGNPCAEHIVLSNMSLALDRILSDVKDPFEFSPYHEAIREPFNYYMFVQNYIRPLINFRESYVGNISLFYEMEEQLKQGKNVILISNHQTEADPAIIALLLETTSPYISENAIYVAGDRVLTDPLCKPFSMGRNLLCVYSKKHMNDVPELAEMKRMANTRTLKEMALLLRNNKKLLGHVRPFERHSNMVLKNTYVDSGLWRATHEIFSCIRGSLEVSCSKIHLNKFQDFMTSYKLKRTCKLHSKLGRVCR